MNPKSYSPNISHDRATVKRPSGPLGSETPEKYGYADRAACGLCGEATGCAFCRPRGAGTIPAMSGDGLYTLETPEHIEVDYELAGVGSRFCAMLIDWVVMWLSILALGCLTLLLDIGLWGYLAQDFGPRGNRVGGWLTWLNAAVFAAISMLLLGYYVFFELFMRGQTPGKRAMRIRAIRDDGTALGGAEVLVRNVVRIVDFLPAFYGLGGVIALVHPHSKRLGDIAAGTIVVKERELDYRARSDKKYALAAAPLPITNGELSAEERRLLQGFLQRRSELLPEARQGVARRLAEPLFQKYGGVYRDAEPYIERLVVGRHHER
jgi:uncharacterized RDD family membrane protein YckC